MFVVIFITALWLFPVNCFSQSFDTHQKVHILKGEYSLKELINIVGKQTGIVFTYSDNIIDSITIEVKSDKQIKLESVFNSYFIPHEIGYKEIDGQIILYKLAPEDIFYTFSGYVMVAGSGEDVIGASVFINDLKIGTITNAYGFFSMRVPKGRYEVTVSCLGYEPQKVYIQMLYDNKITINLKMKTYDVSEVTVHSVVNSNFFESKLINTIKPDIRSLQKLPGLFGENDALRNIAVLPGIQANEMSTTSINVRGGGPEQTVFLMDDALMYNASHFGGFFSVFNPDVVNSVDIYKSNTPVSQGGALSSLVDVHLREGNNQKWQTRGGIGLISARLLVEGPLVKDRSSVLFAFRRSFVDRVTSLTADPAMKNVRFYFYDTNLKLNYKINPNNRVFLSGYIGADSFTQYSRTDNVNYMGSVRWNHLFNTRFFSNTSFVYSRNEMTQGLQEEKDLLYWLSEINSYKFKTDFTWYMSDVFESSFGYSANLFTIYPFSLLSSTDQTRYFQYESSLDEMVLSSIYYRQQVKLNNKLHIDAGVKGTYMETQPFTDSVQGYFGFLVEPQLKVGYSLTLHHSLKASISQQVQPLHQLPVSMVGISVNRWMTANSSYVPEMSRNLTGGYFFDNLKGVSLSIEGYYRKMYHLIETMQDKRILFTDDPKSLLYNSEGIAWGVDMMFSYQKGFFKGMLSYSYCKSERTTLGLNADLPYDASHTREHYLNVSGIYQINDRVSLSAMWIFASGVPYTAANGKYIIDGRTYLQFDDEKINTRKLPPYHRMDISVDVALKRNKTHRWKSFWNFSVYNVYWRKNPLGVAYYIPKDDGSGVLELNPGFYYLYQFVPSVSYRFEF